MPTNEKNNSASEQQEFPWAAIDEESRPSSLEEREAFIDRLPLNRGDRKLLKTLSNLAFPGDGICCDPSLMELQELMDCGHKTVLDRISRCEEAGVIKKDSGKKTRMRNIYRLQPGKMVDLVNTKPTKNKGRNRPTKRSRLILQRGSKSTHKEGRNRSTKQLPYVNASCNKNAYVGDSNSGKKKNPTGGWDRKLKSEDFFRPETVEVLFQIAVKRFHFPQDHREIFYAIAVRSRRANTPGKMFTKLIKDRLRSSLSEDDWTEGKHMMRKFDEEHQPKNAQDFLPDFATTESPRDREQDFETERNRQITTAKTMIHSPEA